MEIIRKIENSLVLWKNRPHRKPLVIRGARQVGKSTSISAFGRRHFENFVVINFERQPDAAAAFTADLDPRRILSQLEVRARQSIRPGQSLLFLDEVQECPEAISALRYFYEELPDLHIIAAGSLLEFVWEAVGIPVGRVEFEWMYPVSFSEFLVATRRAPLAEKLPRWQNGAPTWDGSAAVVDETYKALREYMIVGGMPEATARYIETGSFLAADEVLDAIGTALLADARKYSRGDKQISNLGVVMKRIFRLVGQEITYATLGEHDSGQRTANSVRLLEQAMLCHVVRSASPASLPLGGTMSDKHFKCLFLDIGLSRRLAGLAIEDALAARDLLAIYDGRAAEQFVGQQLLAETGVGSEDRQLYCWIRPQRTAKAEVDYLLSRSGQILPVEVKSGSGGRLRSLQVLLSEYPHIKQAVVLKTIDTIRSQGQSIEMPLFSIL